MNKKYFFSLMACTLILAACFSPWKSDEGTLTVSLGGGNGGARAMFWNDHDIDTLEHTITVSGGPGPKQTRTFTGAQTVSFTVAPGRWNISVEAYTVDNNERVWVAAGDATVDIKPGKNNPVRITMRDTLTANTPKSISSVTDLAKIGGTDTSYPINGNYLLTADLTFTTEWTPIGNGDNPFTGTFDGNSHTINLGTDKVGTIENNAGLFGVIGSGGEVKNLKLQGSITINNSDGPYAGAVAGQNKGTIQNIASAVTVTFNKGEIGGIAGANYNKIKNCYSTGDVTNSNGNNTGGIVGSNSTEEYINTDGTIEYCWASGNIQGYEVVGGIAGYFLYNSPNKTTNCVALNESIEAFHNNQAARIGWDDGNLSGQPKPILSNNYANKDMEVIGIDGKIDITNNIGADKLHGADVTVAEYNTIWWWNNSTAATGGGPGWTINSNSNAANEESPWIWDNNTNRPKLWFE